MKKYFITGLITLLPLALTIALVLFVFNLLTGPFFDLFTGTLIHFHIVSKDFLVEHLSPGLRLLGQLAVLLFLVGLTIMLGMLTRWFFLHTLIAWSEHILHRIPFIRSVYKASKDVVMTVFSSETGAFKQVVMVPFPKADCYTIGLITSETVSTLQDQVDGSLIAVFVPTTPNPISGYLIMYKPEQVIYLDMTIENAFKYIISCGAISAPLQVKK